MGIVLHHTLCVSVWVCVPVCELQWLSVTYCLVATFIQDKRKALPGLRFCWLTDEPSPKPQSLSCCRWILIVWNIIKMSFFQKYTSIFFYFKTLSSQKPLLFQKMIKISASPCTYWALCSLFTSVKAFKVLNYTENLHLLCIFVFVLHVELTSSCRWWKLIFLW